MVNPRINAQGLGKTGGGEGGAHIVFRKSWPDMIIC